MRSEKEMKERINVLEHTICPSPQQEEELKVLEELLEGEPRYSWGEWVERIRENPISERSSELLDHYLICTKEEIQTIQKVVDFHGTPVIKDLGTEPRYSVAELEKIINLLLRTKRLIQDDIEQSGDICGWDLTELEDIWFGTRPDVHPNSGLRGLLKNQKKLEEILND